MANTIKRVEYYYTTIADQPGDAYRLLDHLRELGVNLMAITSVPIGPDHTQLTIFPEDPLLLTNQAKKAGITL